MSTLTFPLLLLTIGLNNAFTILATLMIPLALFCTLIAPRSEGKSIEELESEYY